MHFYFVHPQIKLSNAIKAKMALLKRLNIKALKNDLALFYPDKQFIFTDMGRSAFKLIIEKMNLQNSQMMLPAYICDIFHPILKHYNIKPIFLDIDLRTFNINTEDIQKKITPNVKSILICHTYGLPADIKAIKEIVGNNVTVIEDCAHAFFAKKDGVYAGNFGDISFFSLYKQFPALRGGMVVCPKNWQAELPKTNFNLRDFISFLNYFTFFSFLFKKFGSEIAPKIPRKEKMEKPAGINNTSLSLFSAFFKEPQKYLENRKKLAKITQKELLALGFRVQNDENNVFCYLSVLVPKGLTNKRDYIVEQLRKYGVFCTRIWHTPIILNKEAQEEYQINVNDFPNTFESAKRIINIPLQNYYTEKDAEKIISSIKKVISSI